MCISVLILTLNEELNLPGCLESVAWSDDIVVFDSLSRDNTERIARAAGARFYQRHFDNFAAHRNAALTQIPFKHPWVFALDADERMPESLRDEICDVVASATEEVGAYNLRFKNYLFGKWLKHSSLYPTWVIRLLRVGRVHYEDRLVNAHPVVTGEIRSLQGHFDHYTYSAGFHDWFAEQNLHSSMEATELMKTGTSKSALAGVISRDPMVRRRTLKDLAFRLPARPLTTFLYMYVLRLGFLDGRAGLTYCVLRAIYEYMIDVKRKELARRGRGLTI